jgi:ribonuclease HI
VTTVTQVVEHGWLPDHWSAQRAELYALTRAFTLADGKTVNICTDSRYAFATLHTHGAIYKERGLLTSGGKEVKNSQQILQLLEAVWKPRDIAITHCPAHTN